MSENQCFIGLCIDAGTYKFIPLEFIKFNKDFLLMYIFMSVMHCVCIHIFHSAHICIVYNSMKCEHYFYHQVNS